jgi:phage baseplate assembly protein W
MAIRKKYDFASVGELTVDSKNTRINAITDRQQHPIGIKVPMSFGSDNDGLFSMHYNIDNQLSDNFRNMVMTNHGERLGLPDFGGNLTELAFNIGSEGADTEAIRRIRRTTQKYMPFIDLLTFEPLVERTNNEHVAKVGVRIGYKVSKVDNKERQIEVIIFSAG